MPVTFGPVDKHLLRDWLREYCDEDNRRLGCNAAGYFYGGIPPKGSDVNFNREEDFAESVAAYVFPDEAQQVIDPFYETNLRDLLWYADYRDTLRWQYVNSLINGTIIGP